MNRVRSKVAAQQNEQSAYVKTEVWTARVSARINWATIVRIVVFHAYDGDEH